ncbi:hypothetical protein [Sneathiella litorea]|uniref:Uncharacterized protein n=1 Tax=Sneathiella litorea TaxID=2606216 RepID=A0A6L8W7G9_9PROT|nr:hypothetical protein [Sneathiella litorea]MZR31026.1 hypothetical protein [Sneathiella litorea]
MKKLVFGSLLLALAASPALAKDINSEGPASMTNDVSVGISDTMIAVGDTNGTIAIQGRYATNFGSNNIGATVAPQTIFFPNFEAPYLGSIPANADGSLTIEGASISNTAIGAYAHIEQPSLTISEDGLTDIIQSLVGVGDSDPNLDLVNTTVDKRGPTAGVIVAVGAIQSSPDFYK